MVLAVALGMQEGEVLSLVGGGGKTSIMFGTARELMSAGIPVVTTTTTKIMEPRSGQTPHLYLCQGERIPVDFWGVLESHGHVTLAAGRLPGGKLKGIDAGIISSLKSDETIKLAIIVEADGSAQRPLKAPNETEPVVPEETGHLVAVIGADVFGKRLAPQHVFRPEIYSRHTGLAMGAVITPASIVSSLAHPDGLLRDRPPGASVSVFINKVEGVESLIKSRELAELLLECDIGGLQQVIIGSVKPSPAIMDILQK